MKLVDKNDNGEKYDRRNTLNESKYRQGCKYIQGKHLMFGDLDNEYFFLFSSPSFPCFLFSQKFQQKGSKSMVVVDGKMHCPSP